MKDWFAQLQSQEQWGVLIAATLSFVFLLNLLVWSPLSTEINQLRNSNNAARKTQQWMQTAIREYRQLKTQREAMNRPMGSNQQLSNIINTTIKDAELPMTRFQPKGEKEAQVWLEVVAYDALVGWLYQLETTHGLVIESVSVSKSSDNGRVNARIRLIQTM